MAGRHDHRIPRSPFETRDHAGLRLVDINYVVGFAQTSGVDSVAKDKNRERKSGQTTVQGSRNILGAEIIHCMSCKCDLIMDEAHDPVHTSGAPPRDIMCHKNSHRFAPVVPWCCSLHPLSWHCVILPNPNCKLVDALGTLPVSTSAQTWLIPSIAAIPQLPFRLRLSATCSFRTTVSSTLKRSTKAFCRFHSRITNSRPWSA